MDPRIANLFPEHRWSLGGPLQQNVLVELSSGLINGWWSVSKQCLCKGHRPSYPIVLLTAGFSLIKVVLAASSHFLCIVDLPSQPMDFVHHSRCFSLELRLKGGGGREESWELCGTSLTHLLLQVDEDLTWQVRSLRRPRHCLCCGAGRRCQVLGSSWYLSM